MEEIFNFLHIPSELYQKFNEENHYNQEILLNIKEKLKGNVMDNILQFLCIETFLLKKLYETYVQDKLKLWDEINNLKILNAKQSQENQKLNSLLKFIETNYETDIFQATMKNDLQSVRFCIEIKEINKNSLDENQRTPLFYASQCGHLSIVKYLCEQDETNINLQDINGYSPLHIACTNGHNSIVDYLIEQNAYINQQTNNGSTPLHLAAQNKNKDLIQYLLSKGADKTIKNSNNQTPYDIIQILMQQCRGEGFGPYFERARLKMILNLLR